MPQIDRGSAIHFVLNSVGELQRGQILRIENQKNDRFVELYKFGTKIEIKEHGYSIKTDRIEITQLKSTLGKLIDYEFPRSHKLRIKIRKAGRESGLHLP